MLLEMGTFNELICVKSICIYPYMSNLGKAVWGPLSGYRFEQRVDAEEHIPLCPPVQLSVCPPIASFSAAFVAMAGGGWSYNPAFVQLATCC